MDDLKQIRSGYGTRSQPALDGAGSGLSGDAHVSVPTFVALSGCFGWLHSTRESAQRDVAVLLCPAMNRDALDSHHSMRRLADELACAGYSTLRFDYPGTGDARDLGDVDAWQEWLGSVAQAADWLRANTNARRLVLGGLRIGATLAALASEGRDDVAGLMLLAPVLRGSSYMRQLSIEARLQGGEGGEGIDFHELRLGREVVDRISKVDLRRLALPVCPISVFAQVQSPALSACIDKWQAAGNAVTSAEFGDDLAPMLRHDLAEDGLPVADFGAVKRWLAACVPSVRLPFATASVSGGKVLLRHESCVETPLCFGGDGRLFGVLCRPIGPAVTDFVVIIGNAGRDPHYGLARYGVEFARSLAARGIASLRMDYAGLGDSIGIEELSGQQTRIFEVDRAPDVTAAIDALAELGFHCFAVQGLCAGAYHAFHSALADRRIGMVLLVNMPLFEWSSGQTIVFALQKTYAPGHYLRQLKTQKIWRRVLRNEIDYVGVLVAQRGRLADRLRGIVNRTAGRLGWDHGQSFAQRAMRELASRRVRVLLLMSEGDDGLDAVEREFGPGGKELRRFDGVQLSVVAGLNHTLTSRDMRRVATDHLIEFIAA